MEATPDHPHRPPATEPGGLRIGILSQSASQYSTRVLAAAARRRGHVVRVLPITGFDIHLDGGRGRLLHGGAPVEPFDALIPRIGVSLSPFGLAVLRQFHKLGVWSLNPPQAVARSRDKLWTLQRLARRGIAVPATVCTHDADTLATHVAALGLPVILKPREGTHGDGVALAETLGAARSLFEAFHGIGRDLLLQRFVAEASGSDLRALVLGGKCVAAMRRTAAEGEFRANLHRGGSAEAVTLPGAYRRAAERAARAVGLGMAGVDLLESADGPVVLEVNGSPGLEGIETATGLDLAGAVIEAVERGHSAGACSQSQLLPV